MKKYKIAIIDNGVNRELINNKLENQIVIDENNKYENDNIEILVTDFQHGTICALIIEQYYPDSILISIRILDKNGKGFIERLEPALQWCYQNEVGLINLSLGTTNFSDYEMLNKLINKYTYLGLIIVAATANNNFVTYPACFSNVIGVATTNNTLQYYDKYIHSGVDIVALSNHIIKMYDMDVETPLSNSYATPYVSALVAKKAASMKRNDICTLKRYIWSQVQPSFNGNPYEPDWIYKAYMTEKNKSKANYYFEIISGTYENVEKEIDTIIAFSLASLKELKFENKNIVYLGKENTTNIHTMGFKWSKDIKLNQILNNKYFGSGLEIPLIILDIESLLDEYFILYELKQIFREAKYNAYVITSEPEGILYRLEYIPDIELDQQLLRDFIEGQTYYKKSDLILWSVISDNKKEIYKLYPEYEMEIIFQKDEGMVIVSIIIENCIVKKKRYLKLGKKDIDEIFKMIEYYLVEERSE